MTAPAFARTPLDLALFPPQLHANLSPQAPPPMKMMAASGIMPVPPPIIVRALYQFQFDADENIRAKATASLANMPLNVIGPAIQQEQPAGVLDWVLEVRRADPALVQAILLNPNTDDLTFAALAATADTDVCELIANNQTRVLRCPTILEQLYQNPNTRPATLDKLVDLAQRNGVSLDGLPGVQQALESGEADSTPAVDAEQFQALLQEESAKAQAEEREIAAREEARERAGRREREEMDREDEEEQKRIPASLHARIQNMTISQKVRLATVGSREAIKILVGDPNRLIHMAAIQSPRLQPSDIRKMSSNKSLPDGVIAYIARNREWTRQYDIIVNLVLNPKTPQPDAMRFLNHLRTNDLRSVSNSRGVPGQLARAAKQLVAKRSGG